MFISRSTTLLTFLITIAYANAAQGKPIPDYTIDQMGGKSEEAPTPPAPPLPKNPGSTPGILNPDYQAQCSWIEGVYVCADFAKDYCRQFPNPQNCRYVSIPINESSSHAINLTRVSLGNGFYLYCFVEPQDNVSIACWVGDDDDWDNAPRSVYWNLCNFYRSMGAVCNIIVPYRTFPLEELPDDRCHSTTDGTRCGNYFISNQCWSDLKGSDGVLDGNDCSRFIGGLPESCSGSEQSIYSTWNLIQVVCSRVQMSGPPHLGSHLESL
jgi:hypothetical protein